MYLASPYTTKDPVLKQHRIEQTMKALASLHAQNVLVYSPIIHWVEVAKMFGLRDDHEPWIIQNEGSILAFRKLGILQLDGWKESRGVKHEIDFAWKHRFPIEGYALVGETCISSGLIDVSELSELA
jgi:hypothetical protein